MKRKGWNSILFLGVILVAGCGPRLIYLSDSDRQDLKSQSKVTVVFHPPPSFSLVHSGRAGTGANFGLVGAAIGAASAVSSGDELVGTFGVEDPALKVGNRIASDLEAEWTSARVEINPDLAPEDSLGALKKFAGRGIVVDFKTLEWGIREVKKDQNIIVYSARARMIDLDDSKVMWQGLCDYGKNTLRYPHRLGDFTAEGGTFLKEKLDEAAEDCAEELLAQYKYREPF